MKRNKEKKKSKPKKRELVGNLEGVDIAFLISGVQYMCYPYHKSFPTYCGPPQKRVKASVSSICPDRLSREEDRESLEAWLRQSIQIGSFKRIEEQHDFPKYIWYKEGDVVYEAGGGEWNGVYHGYPLDKSEWPIGIEKLNWNV